MTHVLDSVLAGRRAAVIYPAARMGRRAARMLAEMGVNVVGFGDRQVTGELDGYPVLSPWDVARSGAVVLVASSLFDSEIISELTMLGCRDVVPIGYLNMRLPEVFKSREYEGSWEAVQDPDNAPAIDLLRRSLADDESRLVLEGKLAFYRSFDKQRLEDIRSDDIYFDLRPLGTEEVFVDGGAYVGDTLTRFLELTDGKFRSYVAFEPDAVSFATLGTVTSDPRVTIIRAALSDQTTVARLLSTHGADARILADDEPGGDAVPMVRLDDQLADPPTFLKMDIEGSEAQALCGAARLLRHGRTTLAVSVYHYPTDLWTIPLLIKRLMPDCRLYLRHYTHEVDDTVVYAVPA